MEAVIEGGADRRSCLVREAATLRMLTEKVADTGEGDSSFLHSLMKVTNKPEFIDHLTNTNKPLRIFGPKFKDYP